VDRLNLWQYPLLIGSGKQVFADGTVPTALRLTGLVTYTNGTLQLTYETAGIPTTATSPSRRTACNTRHFDGVGVLVVGQEPVDDPEPLVVLVGEVEAQSPAAGEVAGDVAGAEELAGLAALGQVHDGLQGDVDEPVVDLVQGAEVVEDLG
jgi:hypothetical protein